MVDYSKNAEEREEKLAEVRRAGEESAIQRKAGLLGVPYLDPQLVPADRDNLNLIPRQEAESGQIVVVRRNKKDLKVGVVDPQNKETQQILERLERQGFSVEKNLISRSSLTGILTEYAHIPAPQKKREIAETVQAVVPEQETLASVGKKIEGLEDASMLLETLLSSALALDASDIHIEPQEETVRIRLRLDGVLEDIGTISKKAYSLLLSRVKLVAGIQLNISNTPQDGRFTIQTPGFEAEVRASTLPGAYGEYVVLRVLNPETIRLEIDDLGIRGKLWEQIKKEVEKPNGIVLVTGPTGSGKTTTLYAFLKYLLNPKVKIVTLEDPIEYHLGGVSQSQIEPERDYTFSKGLREVLRQDPDIILVGEIRDEETAQTALNAALTGHLVFSTLHTNDAPGAIPRFLDLNAKPKILAPALNGVIAQRLVRALCNECKKKVKIDSAAQNTFAEGLAHEKEALDRLKQTTHIFGAEGCQHCSGTGYRGRTGIFEVLVVSKKLEDIIGTEPSHQEVLAQARKEGFLDMYHDGLLKVLAGVTTLTEVQRVAQALE